MTRDLTTIGAVAARQAGVVAAWQLRALGVDGDLTSRLSHALGWTQEHLGVWRLAGVPSSPRSEHWAALLALASPDLPRADDGSPRSAGRMHADLPLLRDPTVNRVVFTGLSAAWLLGLVDRPPPDPVVLLHAPHHPDRDGVQVVRTRLPIDGVREARGLPVVAPSRLVHDVAWTHRRDPEGFGVLRDVAVRLDGTRLLPADDLFSIADCPAEWGLPRRRLSLMVRVAAAMRPGFSHSATESRGRRLIQDVAAELGLVATSRPHPVLLDGRVVAEADVAVVALRLDLEIDGPHHRLTAQRRRDRRRDRLAARAAWKVVRFDVDEVADPAAFTARARTEIQTRQRELAAVAA